LYGLLSVMLELVFHAQGGFLLGLTVPSDDINFDDKADILEINGLAASWQFTLRPDERPSEQLMAFLRLVNLSGSDRQTDGLMDEQTERQTDRFPQKRPSSWPSCAWSTCQVPTDR
jgi:Rubisco LSMT substrate-binding